MPADADSINLTHHFLIAMPGLEDEAFSKSVVYLCEHSARGALGLVINKPSDINLGNLFEKVELPLGRGDLARNIRADAKLKQLPIIMITSRIAEKHREHAKELGVDHYLGKPYAEEELLSLVRHYASAAVLA